MTLQEQVNELGAVGTAMTMLLSHLSRAKNLPDERDRKAAQELIQRWDALWLPPPKEDSQQ